MEFGQGLNVYKIKLLGLNYIYYITHKWIKIIKMYIYYIYVT